MIEDLCLYIESNNTTGMANQVDIISQIEFAKNGNTIASILDQLKVFFSPQIKDAYKRSNISPENRFGDFINEAFRICLT
ncbi:MAG TPA: hypothetical protein DHV92_05070 [Ruminococcaceae bacterium]|mgnify:FL=1|nr:hypothetical protein [Oscillospiraceae bacterium]